MNNDNIQGLKLTNGLDLIGDVQGETDDGRLIIKEAFFLQTVQYFVLPSFLLLIFTNFPHFSHCL